VAACFRAGLGAFTILLAAAPALRADPSPTPPTSYTASFLRQHLGLRDGELERLQRGDVVVRMVEDPGFREIAVMAATALPAAPAGWTSGYPLVERLRSASPDLIAMGRFGTPPSIDELAGVDVDPRLLAALQKCQPQRCVMNASALDIDRYRREIDWRSAEAPAAAGRVFRSVLQQRMLEYQRRGDDALPALANRSWELTTSDAPRLLLDRRPSLAQLAPALDARLRACFSGVTEHPSDAFYWVREKMWRREVTGLYHATFDDERSSAGRRRVVAEKLVHANHYLLGALTMTGLIEDGSGTYLFFLNRSETDNRGSFNFIERALAGRLIRRRLERQVEALREAFSATATHAARSSAP
jgi:hypothetical protein